MNENNQIHVWDLFVRSFHWSLVVFFVIAYVTGDDKNSLHRYVGYAVFGLVAVRVLWGFVGSKHARFSDFICSPVKALIYVKDLAVGKPTYYRGHNPAAAWMVLFFLIGNLVICLSGYAAYATRDLEATHGFDAELSLIQPAYADDDEKEEREEVEGEKRHSSENGGKEGDDDAEGDSVLGDIHEISAQCMLFLIFVHIMGVVVSSMRHRENLVRAMFTGKKSPHVS